jgi:hypothetical protein
VGSESCTRRAHDGGMLLDFRHARVSRTPPSAPPPTIDIGHVSAYSRSPALITFRTLEHRQFPGIVE